MIEQDTQCSEIPRGTLMVNPVKRDVRIETLNYGYLVKIDCHTFAVETTSKLNQKLNEFFLDPEETEKKWFKNKII